MYLFFSHNYTYRLDVWRLSKYSIRLIITQGGNSVIIKQISLLTEEQYYKYNSIIPTPVFPKFCWFWWLRTSYSGYTYNVRAVINNGVIDNHYCYRDYGGVRPFCIFGLDVSEIQFWYKPERLIGQKIKHGKYYWTVLGTNLGELYALCDIVIAKRCFDPDTNVWERSELKQWLETEGLKLITN